MSTEPMPDTAPTKPHVVRIHAHKDGYISDEDHQKMKESEAAEAKAKEEFEKKQIERKALRQAQWEKDPEMFIHQDDIIFGAIDTPTGVGVLCGGHPRPKVELAMMRMLYKCMMMFQHMDLQAAMKAKQSEIIKAPDTGIIH